MAHFLRAKVILASSLLATRHDNTTLPAWHGACQLQLLIGTIAINAGLASGTASIGAGEIANERQKRLGIVTNQMTIVMPDC